MKKALKAGDWVYFDLGWMIGSRQIVDIAYANGKAVAYLLNFKPDKNEWIDARKCEKYVEKKIKVLVPTSDKLV